MTQAVAGSVASAGSGGYVMLVCLAMVGLYAFRRYDTPATNRLSTTLSLFYLTGVCYVISTLAMFFVLSEVVLKPGVLQVLGLDDGQKLAAQLSAPLLAAIILTTLLPNVPVISTADQTLLKLFQNWGRIPNGVRHLADRIPQNALSVTDNDIASLCDWISHEGDLPNALKAYLDGSASAPGGWLARAMRLYKATDKLATAPDYTDSFRSQRDAWQALHDDFRIFIGQSHAFFVLFDHLKTLTDESAQKTLLRSEDDYKDTCDKFYGNLSVFLAQMLLMSEHSGHMVDLRLRGIGYDIASEDDAMLPIGPFVFMGLMLMITILGLVALWPQTTASGSLPLAVAAALIGATKAIGAATAVLPKLRWPMFRKGDAGELPYLGWVISACAAAAISLSFERVALAVLYDSANALTDFQRYPPTPLAPTSFMVCLVIAMLCDVDLRLGRGIARRCKEAAICGVTMLASVLICLRLAGLQAPTAFPYIVSTLLGLITGFFGPYLYRQARNVEHEQPLPAPGVVQKLGSA